MNKNLIIVSVILTIVAIISIASYLPARKDAALGVKVADFPKQIGEWVGTDMPIDERSYEILETRNLFIREYKNPQGDIVYLYMIYSEDNRKVSHPPEVCLLGSGITIADKTTIQLSAAVKATRLVVEKADTREEVIYWFKAGNLQTDKYLTQQLKIVIDRLSGKRTAGAMIRMTSSIKDDNEKATIDLMKSFYAQIQPLLERYIP